MGEKIVLDYGYIEDGETYKRLRDEIIGIARREKLSISQLALLCHAAIFEIGQTNPVTI